ncbi:hypothetical protein PDG61_04985 [Mycolicibacterium sp. BiH015]|uniref:hypothetical protein n=1 Tax=Mycolicibacterium sp. BiH015 TaxID=3018808 RepID=UPI0022E02B2D|nr:hypothetical protein [Mycolicibacterium sp. BiH015]MDA2890258.1 hypothetical protein [Mycolicibacterium sp. BiH015]
MSKLVTTTPEQAQADAAQSPHENAHAHQPLVLITTQQVKMATAAAVGLPRRSILARIVGVLIRTSDAPTPRPRHYPPRRSEFLEDAAMQREMHRL